MVTGVPLCKIMISLQTQHHVSLDILYTTLSLKLVPPEGKFDTGAERHHYLSKISLIHEVFLHNLKRKKNLGNLKVMAVVV